MSDKTIVLYDGRCPMCTFQMQLLTWVDIFHRLQLIPYQDQAATEYTDSIDPSALQASIHCVNPRGLIFRGARALRHICMRLPPYIPFALLLWIPGTLYIAHEIYDGISRNRMRISRIFGCTSACKIIPAKQRSGDFSRASRKT